MEIIYKLDDCCMDERTILAIGNFDGIHLGHARLINIMKEENKCGSLKTVLFTFLNNTHNESKLIYTESEKEEIFKELGIDYLYIQEFNEAFSHMTPEEFVDKLLVSVFKCKKVVVGFNFRFGYNAEGNTALLEQLLAKHDIDLIVVDRIVIDDKTVSSTYIRSLIQDGDVKDIPLFLGRPYSIGGRVVKGRQVGRAMGFPTANIVPEADKMMLPTGVYYTEVYLNNKENVNYRGITNIGFNPTFGLKKLSIETHILDFEEDIYGAYIKIYFLDKIRNEKKFESMDKLSEQISNDKSYAKAMMKSGI